MSSFVGQLLAGMNGFEMALLAAEGDGGGFAVTV